MIWTTEFFPSGNGKIWKKNKFSTQIIQKREVKEKEQGKEWTYKNGDFIYLKLQLSRKANSYFNDLMI